MDLAFHVPSGSNHGKFMYLFKFLPADLLRNRNIVPDNKVHGANMGPTWVLWAPDGPHEPCYQGCWILFQRHVAWVSISSVSFYTWKIVFNRATLAIQLPILLSKQMFCRNEWVSKWWSLAAFLKHQGPYNQGNHNFYIGIIILIHLLHHKITHNLQAIINLIKI